MSISVVHVALTPLAGSPIRIVNALNDHTDVRARLVVLNPGAYGNRSFLGDLDWRSEADAAREILASADIVHLHHYFDLENNPFEVNFRELCLDRVRFVRQFHSAPLTIARGDAALANRIVQSDEAQLVIAQYHERFFPRARLVPNVVPLDDELCRPRSNHRTDHPVVFFSPSRDEAAWSVQPGQTRWDTKGAPETERLLQRVVSACPIAKVAVVRNMPHDQCLRARQSSDVAIDEMVTGSYHLTSLEALAQGLPTFAFLDGRTLSTLAELTGTHTHPWLNFRLEEAEGALIELIQDATLRRELGDFARRWMEKYYNDRLMVGHYVRAYEDLLDSPETFRRPRLHNESRRTTFLAQRCDELIWEKRKERMVEARQVIESIDEPIHRSGHKSSMPEWIKAPVHRALRKYTSVRIDEIQALQERLKATEDLLRFVAADETHRWLYQNRLERMDATLDLFDAKRREFHLDRYRFASQRVAGKKVLDCATGTGYGVRLLREIGNAASVIGVDIDLKAIEYARRNHQVGSTRFVCSSADCLALPDASVDIIVSFETIEHVPDDGALIAEFYRVLRPGGQLIVSTPNQWSLADAPFHVREYDRQSFEAVLAPGFECREIYNQNSGSETPLNRGQARGIVAMSAANEQLAECFIAVCRRK